MRWCAARTECSWGVPPASPYAALILARMMHPANQRSQALSVITAGMVGMELLGLGIVDRDLSCGG
jgi:hypothetical protein